ncbi:DUF3556 domain-containing protein [Nocardioides sp.]|uniref:DUF3556 domain-containing protein n=1 Tax=Nocardioides sp. TaxID=35761 RepID=UPI002636C5B6|nr:DUF3556 domain-containing protein [Nocardioides sp.]
MGLISPRLPDLDYEEWERKPLMQRIKPMAQDWAEGGFGTPDAVLVLYVVKIALYAFGAAAITALTPGIGSLGDIGDWWTEPIFFQKVVVFTLLFEVLGLGCGFGPLTLRFLPPVGAPLHWLRPGTIRLPPWPARVPLTAGTTRSMTDVALYVAVVAAALWLLLSPGQGESVGSVGRIDPWRFLPLFAALGLIGLRDKTIFLAARTEVYGTLALMFLFSGADLVVGVKFLIVLIWWGAAFSKLNQHFPHVVAVMMSNSPILRVKALKRRFHRDFPEDLRPGRLSENLAHGGTVIEFGVPLVLLLSNGGWPTYVAAVVMICFHLQILTSLPMGVPLEWNVFMIFAIGFLFVDKADVSVGDMSHPVLVFAIVLAAGAVVVTGNFFPKQFSFLPSMRYYAGNWATSLWCLTPEAVAKLDGSVNKVARLPSAQLETLYDAEMATLLSHKVFAFRSMHTHGRALFALIPRACGEDRDVVTSRYAIHDGEFVAGIALGWNFGEGHLHNEQLVEALQERCGFEPGEVRVVMLESQRFLDPRQEYRIVDGATGEIERGVVKVADMLERQPWDGEIPTYDVVVSAAPHPT